LTVSHTGSGTFTISALDRTGASTGERIVETSGDYSGVVPFGLHGIGSVATSLTISSSGSWSKWQHERQGKTISITVYLSDGTTRIGTFEISG
jgi:hypothetical protein